MGYIDYIYLTVIHNMGIISYYDEGRELGGIIWAEKNKLSFQDFLKLLDDTLCDLFPKGMRSEESREKLDGLFAFIQEKEVEVVNVKKFNADIVASKNDVDYDSLIRIVDRLLPPPDIVSLHKVGKAVEIPVEIRPHIRLSFPQGAKGFIGRMYFQDSGMNMWLPHCDVYSEDHPDELLEKGVSLLYERFVTSEILLALQKVVDPTHKNSDLEEAIARSLAQENAKGNALYDVLSKHQLAVVSLKACNRSVRCCDDGIYGDLQHLFLANSAVKGIAEDFDDCLFITEILPSTWNYDYIVTELKAAVNIAKGRIGSSAHQQH